MAPQLEGRLGGLRVIIVKLESNYAQKIDTTKQSRPANDAGIHNAELQRSQDHGYRG
jgi:hypothetical protein